jgi:hypothetical protein
LKASIAVISILIITFGLLYFNGYIGVSKWNLEEKARADMCIESNWEGKMAVADSIAGFIFYDKTMTEYKQLIYINWPNSFGYFFASGGCSYSEMEGVVKYCSPYNEAIYLSMNKQKVNKVEVKNGDNVKTIEIDDTKPFAVALSDGVEMVSFYDLNENIVDIYKELHIDRGTDS